jgi:hypothetical protein
MAMLLIAGRPAVGDFSDSTSRHAGGLIVDLAVIPASFVLGHSPEQTGEGMHGGRSNSRYSHHLIVAVFDAQSGSRITDAAVKVFVTSSRHPAERADLEPMTFGTTAAYGAFVDMPPRDTYHITIEVRRRDGKAPVTVDFWHQHLQP